MDLDYSFAIKWFTLLQYFVQPLLRYSLADIAAFILGLILKIIGNDVTKWQQITTQLTRWYFNFLSFSDSYNLIIYLIDKLLPRISLLECRLFTSIEPTWNLGKGNIFSTQIVLFIKSLSNLLISLSAALNSQLAYPKEGFSENREG